MAASRGENATAFAGFRNDNNDAANNLRAEMCRELATMGQRLQARAGWGQWPHCTKKLGYR